MKQKCTTCKEDKELTIDNFYKNGSYSTGYAKECIPCVKKRAMKRQERIKQDRDWEKNMFL